MGLELAKAFVHVRGDSRKLPGDMNNAKKIVTGAMNDIKMAAAGITAGIAAAGIAAMSAGIQAVGQLEQNTVKLETMLGSASEAQKTIAMLTDFAARTPFEMPGIMQVATQMVAFGESGAGMMETLRMIADASGGTAQDFQLLGLVYNQVRGVGKLLTQDFRQMATRGMISMQDIADFYDVTTSKAQEMMSNGEIAFEDFKAIMKGLTSEGGRFAGMADKMSQTMIGLYSTFNDVKRIMFQVLAAPMLPYLKNLLTTMITLTTNTMEFIKASDGAVTSMFNGAIAANALAAGILGAGVAARFFGVTLRGALIGTGIGAILVVIGSGVGALYNLISQNIEVLDGWKNAWMNVVETATHAWQSMVSYILGPGSSWLETFQGGFLSVFQRIGESIEMYTANWSLTWKLFTLNAQLAFVSFRETLQAGFRYLWENGATMALNAFSAIGQGFLGVLTIIKDGLVLSWKSISAWGKAVVDGMHAWWRGETFMDGFTETLGEELNRLSGELPGYMKGIETNMGKGMDALFGTDSDTIKSQISDVYAEMDKQAKLRRERRKYDAMGFTEKEATDATAGALAGVDGPGGGGAAAAAMAAQAAVGVGIDAGKEGMGRVGFADLGTKIQDDLLKGENLDSERNELLKQQHEEQKKTNQMLEKSTNQPGRLA